MVDFPFDEGVWSPDQRSALQEAFERCPDKQQFRIEALHAASRITAGAVSGGHKLQINYKDVPPQYWTLYIAEYIAGWLENGER